MNVALIITALLLGLGGSFHCLGMCGPIVLVLPVNRQDKLTVFIQTIIYHLGRVLTYSTLGLFFGLLGKGLYLAGFQQRVSILMGVIMVLSVIFPTKFLSKIRLTKSVYKLVNNIKKYLGKYLKKESNSALFIIGLLSGLLPCGLVYMALIGAVATGDTFNGAVYMFFFGIGTSPLLSIFTLIGNFVSIQIRNTINKILPYFVVMVGIIFILRGLGLDIKFISPPDQKLDINRKTKVKSCTYNQPTNHIYNYIDGQRQNFSRRV